MQNSDFKLKLFGELNVPSPYLQLNWGEVEVGRVFVKSDQLAVGVGQQGSIQAQVEAQERRTFLILHSVRDM